MKKIFTVLILGSLLLGCTVQGEKLTWNDFFGALGAVGEEMEKGADKRQERQLRQAMIRALSEKPVYYHYCQPTKIIFYDSNRSVVGYGMVRSNQTIQIYDTNRNYLGYAITR
ncbi:MAG: hypothetical protein V2A69_11450 [Pseudomonadota bacterium]